MLNRGRGMMILPRSSWPQRMRGRCASRLERGLKHVHVVNRQSNGEHRDRQGAKRRDDYFPRQHYATA